MSYNAAGTKVYDDDDGATPFTTDIPVGTHPDGMDCIVMGLYKSGEGGGGSEIYHAQCETDANVFVCARKCYPDGMGEI